MAFRHILLTEAEGVATITLNRPEQLNALDAELVTEILEVVSSIRDGESSARCLLLTGAGRGFSSGAALSPGNAGGKVGPGAFDAGLVLETHFNILMERLFDLPVPYITAVNGVAAGAGCSYALSGDLVVAGKSAYFMQAFVNVGLVPDCGSTWMLPRMIGRARAQRMMMLGERITADTAFDWGMVSEVVEDADLMPRAMEIAKKLAAGPTKALTLIRRGLRESMESTLSETLLMERNNQRTAGLTKDFEEGVAAFIGKRKAVFSGL